MLNRWESSRLTGLALLALAFAFPLTATAQDSEPGWVGLAFGPGPGGKVVFVVNVAPKSPAAEAGVAVGEAILKADGRPVKSSGHLKGILDRKRPGQTLKLVMGETDGKTMRDVELKVAPMDVASLCENALAEGIRLLTSRQVESGGWIKKELEEGVDVPLSALCVRALVGLPEDLRGPHMEAIHRGTAFLLKFQAPDGSIVGSTERQHYRTYASGLALQIMVLADPEKYASQIEQAKSYLIEAQLDDGEKIYEYDFARYGAWNIYDENTAATMDVDLSCSSYAIEGLTLAKLDPASKTAKQHLLFLRRTQNLPREGTEVPPALFDGGFTVNPRSSKAGMETFADGTVVFRPYGSTTADGLRTLLRLGIPKTDQRVKLASTWLGRFFTLTKNPNFPTERGVATDERGIDTGIYYYYLNSMSDALHLAGDRKIQGPNGTEIDWPDRLARRLITLQKPDGSWQGDVSIMNEDDPNLSTPFAIMCLARCREYLRR